MHNPSETIFAVITSLPDIMTEAANSLSSLLSVKSPLRREVGGRGGIWDCWMVAFFLMLNLLLIGNMVGNGEWIVIFN